MSTPKFGSHETIHTQSFDKALGKKIAYLYGEAKGTLNKSAESFHVEKEEDVIAKFLATLKSIRAGTTDFSCIELFTDEHKITRINICNMTRE